MIDSLEQTPKGRRNQVPQQVVAVGVAPGIVMAGTSNRSGAARYRRRFCTYATEKAYIATEYVRRPRRNAQAPNRGKWLAAAIKKMMTKVR
jgi:hypothetical protein